LAVVGNHLRKLVQLLAAQPVTFRHPYLRFNPEFR
jgi:hypothetical protein